MAVARYAPRFWSIAGSGQLLAARFYGYKRNEMTHIYVGKRRFIVGDKVYVQHPDDGPGDVLSKGVIVGFQRKHEMDVVDLQFANGRRAAWVYAEDIVMVAATRARRA